MRATSTDGSRCPDVLIVVVMLSWPKPLLDDVEVGRHGEAQRRAGMPEVMPAKPMEAMSRSGQRLATAGRNTLP